MKESQFEKVQNPKNKKTNELEINDSISYLLVKRLVDIFGSLTGLLMFLPLFFILAVMIKVEDPKGPIFFKQVRVGKDGKKFNMYKFRSMITNAEDMLKDLLDKNEVSGLMFKMKDDPRITRVGKFIRKTSIDEIPQLFNVLKGDMSLVGPRPPLMREVKEYSNYHKQRLLVTPGCTGIWQVSARNEVGFDQMVEMDLEYMKCRSLVFDVKLIISTVLVMINSKAY